jgi:HEAT repeat protein
VSDILDKLKGGDRRSIGRVDEVVAEVLDNTTLFDDLFSGLQHDDPLVRMRSADAMEKITARYPEYLDPYKTTIIEEVAPIDQQEVRWHVAQMVPRLDLRETEVNEVFDILLGYLDDDSKIVKTFSMQALADLAQQHPELIPQVTQILEEQTRTGSPAMKSRGRKLLIMLRSS